MDVQTVIVGVSAAMSASVVTALVAGRVIRGVKPDKDRGTQR